MNIVMTGLEHLVSLAGKRAARISTHSGTADKGDIFVSLPRAVPVGPEGPDYSGAETYLADALRAGVRAVVCTPAVLEAAQAALTQDAAKTACDAVAGEVAAAAVLSPSVSPEAGLTVAALVPNPRAALGELAGAYYGTDHSGVSLLGITGTNGKTTSAYLLEAILRAAGKTPGLLGTVEYRWPGHAEASPLTTPDCLALHAMVAAMGEAGADTALMEVSSHAIDQNRIAGLSFAGALFTNLTQDHLDYHRDMEEYFTVKAKLFTPRERGGLAARDAALAVNIDDPYGERLFAANRSVTGFSLRRGGDGILQGTILEQGREGLRLAMACAGKTWDLASPLVGEFNAANLLGAQALALAFGVDTNAFQALSSFGGVPGRLERIVNPQGLSVFVDYAHTPDALQKALQALRGANFTRIVTVFGCGGNRDKTKRPLMGEAASRLSDVVVLTSDNPRREEPLRIMADIRPGLAGAKTVIEEVDRKKAIGMALDILRAGDALLIAGKGHEPYQIIGETKYPFSDRQVVREYLGCA